MSYRYSEFGYDGASCIDCDPFEDKHFIYKTCPICGHLYEAGEIINTDQGEMCPDCFDYLCEIDDDKPVKL